LRGLQEFRRHTGYAAMAEHPAPRRRATPRLALAALAARARRLAARALEIPGMLDAPRRREAIPRTTYRQPD
jgi:hypothetical protein